jgi:hypothetical protein
MRSPRRPGENAEFYDKLRKRLLEHEQQLHGGADAPSRRSKSETSLHQRSFPDAQFRNQDDITTLPKPADPAISPNLLTSTYGGWTAVENASLALAESARLLAVPGRSCSSGVPAPVQRADWVKFSEGLRAPGLTAYKAAQSKSTDAMVEAGGAVADACQACHDVYREKRNPADRCKP